VGRLAPRASVTLGRIQAISAGKGPLNNCQKAMLSSKEDCSRENSNSHSLTAPPTCQFQNSVLPYSPRFTPTHPTYRSQASHPIISTAPTPPHTPHPPHPTHPTHPHPTPTHRPRTLPASPQPSAPIGASASHPTTYGACTLHPPHPPHPTHNHPTATYRAPPLTQPTHPTPPTPTLPSRTPRTPVRSLF